MTMSASHSPLAPRIRLSPPTQVQLNAALAAAQDDVLPYGAVGASRTQGCPPGYRRTLGQGRLATRDFTLAKHLLRDWQGFPNWVRVHAGGAVADGQNVVVVGHVFGLWITNSCRVTYVIDEADTYGFGYGALTQHVEEGEERFLLRRAPDGEVEYEIYSFSRPNHWTTRLGLPITRRLQRRFIADAISDLRDRLTLLR